MDLEGRTTAEEVLEEKGSQIYSVSRKNNEREKNRCYTCKG